MAPRRTHTKSRTGCANCKRRKVKCDEAYPTCFNCKRHGVSCSLSGPASPSEHASTPTQPNLLSPAPSSNDVATPPDVRTVAAEGIAPFPPDKLITKDFELMHHYCTVTADCMSVRQEMSHVWRVVIPKEGYQHRFVMDGILAVAAAHKAYLMPNNKKTYLALSHYHQTVGSEGFRSALQNICPETAMSIFSFASVVVLFMYTLPSRSVNGRLENPIHNILEVIGLLRGIKATLSPLMQGIMRSECAPLVYGVWPLDDTGNTPSVPTLDKTMLPMDTWDAMSNLRAFLEAEVPSSSLDDYTHTIDNLERSIRLVALAGVYVETGAVLAWMYGIRNSILVDVASHRSHALVILAYYSILLATLEKSFC